MSLDTRSAFNAQSHKELVEGEWSLALKTCFGVVWCGVIRMNLYHFSITGSIMHAGTTTYDTC